MDGKIARERDWDSRVVPLAEYRIYKKRAHLATDLEEAFEAASAFVPRREPATSTAAGASADLAHALRPAGCTCSASITKRADLLYFNGRNMRLTVVHGELILQIVGDAGRAA